MMLKIVNFLDSIKPDILSLSSVEEDRVVVLLKGMVYRRH